MKKIIEFILVLLCIFAMILGNYKPLAIEDKKIVYLTFDDGPSYSNSNRILDVLKREGVRASFFVVGRNANMFPEVIKEMDKNNMDVYPHCNNHTYKELYSSKDFYMKDLKECQGIINKITGKDVGCAFVRMPGGSDNLVGEKGVLDEIKNELMGRGIDYVDWNVDSGDALAVKVSSDKIKRNIYKDGYKYRVEVLLMHDLDNKTTTTDVLESVINEYKMSGYKFKTLSEMEPWEKQYLKEIRVINRK